MGGSFVHYCILHSPTDPHGVHLQSTFSPPPVLLQCPPLHSTPHGVHMESTRSICGVDCNRTLDLVKLKSIGGVLVESWWTPCGIHKDCAGMCNKMHPQGIEHTISCIDAYMSNSTPLPIRPYGLEKIGKLVSHL